MTSELYSRTLYSPGLRETPTFPQEMGMVEAEVQTLARITELEEKWRQECETLTLYQRPFKTIRVFIAALASFAYRMLMYILSHKVFLRVALPLAILWLTAELVPGSHSDFVKSVDFAIEYVVWWVGLGVLSSIGLGSGLQTGVLFMFPHIMKVCLTAESCRTTSFESFSAIWFRVSDTLFKCPDALGGETVLAPASYFGIWRLIIVPSFLQAAGTAIGEIPPYWITKASRLAAIQAGQRSGAVPEELEIHSEYGIINRVKSWLVTFLKTHGFLGVFLMASWPNFAFDLCGICCGHFLMPFWTFFGATLIGKAVVRNTYQTLFMVAIFNEKYMEHAISIVQRLAPDSLNLDSGIRRAFEDIRASSHRAVAEAGAGGAGEPERGMSFSFVWGIVTTLILCFFLLSCIQQFAQFYQTMQNNLESDRLRGLLSAQVRQLSASPRKSPAAELIFSGRLSPNPVVLNRMSSQIDQIPSAAKNFAQKMRSKRAPKYDIMFISTTSEDSK